MRGTFRKWIGAFVATLCTISFAGMGASGTLATSTLLRFDGTNGGSASGLIQSGDGYLYGMTTRGWVNQGTIFRLSLDGNLTNLAYFYGTNGVGNYTGHLIEGADGNFYGTTAWGGFGYTGAWLSGSGTVFRVTRAGDLTTLATFDGTNGARPWPALLQGQDGGLYGFASEAGPGGYGTLFRISTDGAFETLVSFDGTNGAAPMGELLQTEDGLLYGTTSAGGSNNLGTVFRATTNGTLTTIFCFAGTNGTQPIGGLIRAADGFLYGVTEFGGSDPSSLGTVFRTSTNGDQAVLASFHSTNGANPGARLVQTSDGTFYGTTFNGGMPLDPAIGGGGFGSLFSITTNGVLQTIVSFGYISGFNPLTPLVEATDGNLYGSTWDYWSAFADVYRLAPVVAPTFQSISSTNGGILLTWSTVPGQHYLLQFASDLSKGDWTAWSLQWSGTLGMNTATNETTSFFDNWYSSGHPQGFYRLMVIP